MIEKAAIDCTLEVLDTAWTFAVGMFLSNAPHPSEWTISTSANSDAARIHIGKKTFLLESHMQASMLQGCLTVAYFAVQKN